MKQTSIPAIELDGMPIVRMHGYLVCTHFHCPKAPRGKKHKVWVSEDGEEPTYCAACKSMVWNRKPEKRGPKPQKRRR